MKHLFVPYQLALLAKQKGFNQPFFAGYSISDGEFISYLHSDDKTMWTNRRVSKSEATAPLYQQIVDWFRIKHGIMWSITPNWSGKKYNVSWYGAKQSVLEEITFANDDFENLEYYELQNKAIEEAFKLIPEL